MTVPDHHDALAWGIATCVVLARDVRLTERRFLDLVSLAWRVRSLPDDIEDVCDGGQDLAPSHGGMP